MWGAAAAALAAGLSLSSHLYGLDRATYYTLHSSHNSEGAHRCIFCGNGGTYERRGLFVKHTHCEWCRAHLFSR
jgi:hypothetical protein